MVALSVERAVHTTRKNFAFFNVVLISKLGATRQILIFEFRIISGAEHPGSQMQQILIFWANELFDEYFKQIRIHKLNIDGQKESKN